MILIHRLRGEEMFLNADLIESIQASPDTIITTVEGRKIVVAESPEEIVDRIRVYRASILAAAEELRNQTGGSVIVFPVTDDE